MEEATVGNQAGEPRERSVCARGVVSGRLQLFSSMMFKGDVGRIPPVQSLLKAETVLRTESGH